MKNGAKRIRDIIGPIRLRRVASLALAALLLAMGASAFANPMILSHRGASYWAPEETRASYLLASLLGGDYWEMDIQRTKDNVLIALHDLTLERTTNVAEIFPSRKKDPVNTFTWDELQKLDAGSWFNKVNPERAREKYKGLKILSLEEVIDLALSSKYAGGLYVESKNPEHYPGMEVQMFDLLQKKKWTDGHKLYFQSFGRDSGLVFQKIAPRIPFTFLIDDDFPKNWLGDIKFGVEHKMTLGPSQKMFMVPKMKTELIKAGYPIHAWTIDEEKQMLMAQKLNFEAVFTNRTDLAAQIYKHAAKPDVDGLLKSLGY